MSQQKVGIIAGAMVLVMAAGASVVFADRPEDYDRLVLVKPILEADLVLVVKDAQYLALTKDEIIDKFSGVRILYNWSGQGKAKPAAKPGDSKPTPSPTKTPAEIVVITPGEHGFNDPVIRKEQIVFLKIDRLTPDRLKEYRRGIVQENERIAGGKLSPAEKSEQENRLKGTELVCRPCFGWQSALELNPDAESLSNKIFKERYKITKSADVLAAVQSLCAWRDMKTQQEKVDYLLKLLNDNPKNQLYLDNVPELLKSLGVNAEQKGGRYVAAPPAPPAAKDKDVAK